MPDTFNTDLSALTASPADLLSAERAAQAAASHIAGNGLRYSTYGLLDAPHTAPAELARLVGTVPEALTAALGGYLYAFVPLALSAARLAGDESAGFSPDDKTLVASRSTSALADKATCHRNAPVSGTEHVFLSSGLHPDRFALAFEFFINVSHNFVDTTGGLPSGFSDLVWSQAISGVRGETSIDAWEHRSEALGEPTSGSGSHPRRGAAPESARFGEGSAPGRSAFSTGNGNAGNSPRAGKIDEKARNAYLETAFSDTLAIYLLSLYLDFDYADLRERDYPLLAPAALAERLRLTNRLFPANPGYEFAIRYRRKG